MKCCVKLKTVQRTINLLDTVNFNQRIIRLYQCPICLFPKAELQQYNIKTQRFEYESPKRKKLKDWLSQYEKEPYLENVIAEIKKGCKSNMHWYYQHNGNVYNFNDTLIKQKREVYGRS